MGINFADRVGLLLLIYCLSLVMYEKWYSRTRRAKN